MASIAAFPQQLPLNSWGEVREGFWETCRCQVLEPGQGLKELSPRLGSKCRSGHRNRGHDPPLSMLLCEALNTPWDWPGLGELPKC